MTGETIRAAFVKQEGGVELREVTRPEPEPGSVMVRMKASGICGTDLEKLTGKGITSSILGHEVAGIVTESKNSEFETGNYVIPHHHVACGKCDLCVAGAGTMCEGFRTSNFIPGGFADEFLVPQYNVAHGGVHRMSSDLSFEEASFAEPLACCIRGLARVSALRNLPRKILLVGAGPIGLLHMELIRAMSPESKLWTVDILQSRLAFAEKNEGARPIAIVQGTFSDSARSESGGTGFDLVVVATGSSAAFAEGLRCIRRSGSLLLFGAPHKGATHNLDLSELFLKEYVISSSYSATEQELSRAIQLLEGKKINVKKFVSATFPLDKIEQAMSSARSENQVKVIVTPGH